MLVENAPRCMTKQKSLKKMIGFIIIFLKKEGVVELITNTELAYTLNIRVVHINNNENSEICKYITN